MDKIRKITLPILLRGFESRALAVNYGLAHNHVVFYNQMCRSWVTGQVY